MWVELTNGTKSGDGEVPQVVADGGRPQLDRIITALATEQRRYLLYYLTDSEVATLETCTTAVAVRETWCPPADISTETYERVKNQLYHRDLPKLSELDIVEYDQRSSTVSFDQPPPALGDFLRLARETETG